MRTPEEIRADIKTAKQTLSNLEDEMAESKIGWVSDDNLQHKHDENRSFTVQNVTPDGIVGRLVQKKHTISINEVRAWRLV